MKVLITLFVTGVVVSLLITGLVFGIVWIIRKINPELGAKIDEFLKYF